MTELVGDEEGTSRWAEVLAKATAMLAMHAAKVDEKTTLEQAEFLEALGITRPEAAAMLGVSPTTLYTAKHKREHAQPSTKAGKRGKGSMRGKI